MALTQMELIQSLGEAMRWFQKEVAWGVDPAELSHLCGRMGELFVAVVTNGQLARTVNQRGYDVVSSSGERISVKTTTMESGRGHITLNPRTLDAVDRVMILFVNTCEMQIDILFDGTPVRAKELSTLTGKGALNLSLSKIQPKPRPLRSTLSVVRAVERDGLCIQELESGTIQVMKGQKALAPVLPVLREVARDINVPTNNDNGNPYNTRQLGTLILDVLQAATSVQKHT